MGAASSNNSKKKYNNSEIQKNIEKVFSLNNNNFSEASLKYNPNLSVSDNSVEGNIFTKTMIPSNNDYIIGGKRNYGNNHFSSGRNRYDKYNINNILLEQKKKIKKGGSYKKEVSDDIEELSNFSELDRIRDYMLNKMDNQKGGNCGCNNATDDVNYSDFDKNMKLDSITPKTSVETPFNFTNLMKGGIVESDDEFDDIDNDLDFEDLDLDDDVDDDVDVDDEMDEDTDNESDELTNDGYISTTSQAIKKNQVDLLSMYSSDSDSDYEFQHPISKRRF